MKSTSVNGIRVMIGDGVFVGAEELVCAKEWSFDVPPTIEL